MFNQTPYVGQMIDFYSLPTLRIPALCVEVFPTDIGERPKVNLYAFYPDGNNMFFKDVSPVNTTDVDEDLNPILKQRWGFQHEFAILQTAETLEQDSCLGTHSNEHVGSIAQNV